MTALLNPWSLYSWLALACFVVLPIVAVCGALLPSRFKAPRKTLLLRASLPRVWQWLFVRDRVPEVAFVPGTLRSCEFQATFDESDEDVEAQEWLVELAKSKVMVRVSDVHSTTDRCSGAWLFADVKFPTAIAIRVRLEPSNGGGTLVSIDEECTVHASAGAWQVPFFKIAFWNEPSFVAPHVFEQLLRLDR